MLSEASKKKKFKQITFWCLSALLSAAAGLTATHAWLNRLASQTSAAGFSLVNSGTVMQKTYRIDTYYSVQDGVWRLITSDFERDGEEWNLKWDDNSAILVPGKRTEFKTVVTSLSQEEQSVSLYLQGVSVDRKLKDRTVIGIYEPEMILYDPEEEAYFTQNDTAFTADHLPVCQNQVLAAFESVTVRWYVSTGTETTGGGFTALSEKNTGNAVTDGNGHYYFVNERDSEGNPKEAFLCDETGVLLTGNQEYSGDYSETGTTYVVFGDTDSTVKISGLYAAIG